MANKPILIVSAVALLSGVVLIASEWRGEPEGTPAEPDAAARGLEDAPTDGRGPVPEMQAARSPGATPATNALPAELSQDTASQDQDPRALMAGIDPLLRDRAVIMPTRTGPGFAEIESRFRGETADPRWSSGMEARILGEVAQIPGLKLVSLEAQCRATICRVKLFHPAGTKPLLLSDNLEPIAKQIGFAHAIEVATLGEDGVPISLLYFQGEEP
jgi:hypothetical protein